MSIDLNNTAYGQALSLITSGQDPTGSSIPSYITSADNINVANENRTFLDSALDVVEDIPKFIGLSIISGANQIYNIAPSIGNLFGGDFELSDTGNLISSIDSDLGNFYQAHKEGIDLVGFLASSAIPGIGGVKLLNAGQQSLRAAIRAGTFGKNTGRALGLLAPSRDIALKKALKDVVNNSSTASLLNREALKAVGAGVGQNALEALAFETAVAATMFNSPILENQDFGDFISNVAFGAGVFGIVGGAIDATKISSQLKKAVDAAAIEARPWTHIAEAASTSKPFEKIVLDYEQAAHMPSVLPRDDIGNLTPTKLKQLAETKKRTLDNRIRKNYSELAGGDQEVADVMFERMKTADLQTQQSSLIGAVEISRFGHTAPLAKGIEKLQKKVAKGSATLDEVEQLMAKDEAISYTRLWGEGVGDVTTEPPVITSLVDTLKKGQEIKVTQAGVTAGKIKYPFSITANTTKKAGVAHWDVTRATAVEANARYIWASRVNLPTPSEGKLFTVHADDIPLLERVYDKFKDTEALQYVNVTGLKEGESVGTDFYKFLTDRKLAVAHKLLKVRGGEDATKFLNQDEIAAIVNVKSNFLSGVLKKEGVEGFSSKDLFALQDHAEEYTNMLVKQGARREQEGLVDIWKIPQTVKLTYSTKPFGDEAAGLVGINKNVIENMVIIKEQQKLYQDATKRASAAALGNQVYEALPDITSGRVFAGAVPSGAGHGLITAASSNYGTLAGTVEFIGSVTSRAIQGAKTSAREALEPLLYKLGQNQEAAVEWATLNQRIRAIEGHYALNEAGDALEPLVLVKWRKASAEAVEAGQAPPPRPEIPNADMPERIDIKSPEVRALAKAHVELNGVRTSKLAGIRTAQGAKFKRDPEAFYPIPVNPKDYPHFALVIDESITSGNHSKTLFATSAEELDGMVSKIKDNPHLTVLTKKEAEDYYKARGRWDYEKTLNSNYLDVEARRKGVSAPFLVSTDPTKIVTDSLSWHLDRETGLVREAVAAKYEVQFKELQRLGDQFTNIETSRFSDMSLMKYAEDTVKNPFGDYIKTALGIRKNSDYPWWVNVNKMADTAVSRMFRRIDDVFDKSKSPEELKEINNILEKAGYKGAQYDESMELFANATPARGTLSTAVQKANSLMATVVLRWDSLNAVNNAVSANVLLGAETKAVLRAIGRGDEEAVGALAKLAKIKVPGTDEEILAPQKLIANAIKKFGSNTPEMEFYKANGYMTSISDQYRDALDKLTFTGKEAVGDWETRLNGLHKQLKALGDKGEKWTGNRLAEEFNRFVAADVMKQLTDVAVTRELMSTKEQLAYINTFVNRTQGNYLAAQRPMMFQGPIGQAIGLFQTYQFNLMQQLLRYVGEGHSKDAMTLLALQGTIHGMNGLPAFNAVNTHLVGTASGNASHKDAYDAVYGIAGKEGGDWLMYGLASNALGLIDPDLKVNLYTRGDINPRHVTIIPTNPSSVPIVQASAKVFSNLFKTAKEITTGADVSTALLQGLEHNGLSRPLAGLAQTLEGLDNPLAVSYSTSKQGNVVASNDFLSLTNLVRIAGGKPLDEAVALDATYRYKSYAAADAKKRMALGQAIKTTLIAGKEPSQDQIESFALKYAELGGTQKEFGAWFTQLYRTANVSQANKIKNNLNSPFSQSMQRIMGGEELEDFTQ